MRKQRVGLNHLPVHYQRQTENGVFSALACLRLLQVLDGDPRAGVRSRTSRRCRRCVVVAVAERPDDGVLAAVARGLLGGAEGAGAGGAAPAVPVRRRRHHLVERRVVLEYSIVNRIIWYSRPGTNKYSGDR